MSPRAPDFFDLVGDEGTPEELAQLRRAHDLLLAAGPPPELSPRLAEAPAAAHSRGRSTCGAADGHGVPARSAPSPLRPSGSATSSATAARAASTARGTPIAMHPPASAGPSTARASILIGDRDEVGNWPLLVRASGLKPLPKGQWYELYLTRKGKIRRAGAAPST